MKILSLYLWLGLWTCVTLAHAPQVPGIQSTFKKTHLPQLVHRRATPNEDVEIDGTETTIGLATTYYFRNLIRSFSDIMEKILGVMLPPPETDIDYFEIIKENVKQVVGDYIDEHNMHQLEIYKSDLGTLLQRYLLAPVHSETYPDKNTVANSLSTSIITNRFLVEAGERPESMIIHFADIASMHILVLQDVAETYSSGEFISRWWVDLNDQLDHYIDHGKRLQDDVVDWRNDMMTCTFDEGNKYDIWTMTCTFDEGNKYDIWTVDDKVADLIDECKELHGRHECDDHCQAYQINMNREVTLFIWEYMGKPLMEWETLKIKAEEMAEHALGNEYV